MWRLVWDVKAVSLSKPFPLMPKLTMMGSNPAESKVVIIHSIMYALNVSLTFRIGNGSQTDSPWTISHSVGKHTDDIGCSRLESRHYVRQG